MSHPIGSDTMRYAEESGLPIEPALWITEDGRPGMIISIDDLWQIVEWADRSLNHQLLLDRASQRSLRDKLNSLHKECLKLRETSHESEIRGGGPPDR